MTKDWLLHYGNTKIKIDIPFGNVITGTAASNKNKQIDFDIQLRKCLNELTGTIGNKLIKKRRKTVIVIDDYTRPTPVRKILPELIEFLIQKGIPCEDISILIASGFHRRMTNEEISVKAGSRIYEDFKNRIFQHNAMDEACLSYLGKTIGGIPVHINKTAVQADILIGIGTVEIHPWAGFSGGPKIICPGVAGKKTINHTHTLPVTCDCVDFGIIEGNPFWEAIYEASKMAGLDAVINAVMKSDDEVSAVFSGEAMECQQKCIKYFKKYNRLYFNEPADVVITTSNPKHQYWGQAAIAGFNAARVVKKGGTRIILAKCEEGFGDSQREIEFYLDSLKDSWEDLDEYWEKKQGKEYDNSRNASAVYRHLRLLQESNMIMVSKGFPSPIPPLKSMKIVRDIEDAFQFAGKRYGKDASVIIFDMGAMVLPTISL